MPGTHPTESIEMPPLKITAKQTLAAVAVITFGFWTYHKVQKNWSDIEVFAADTLPALTAPAASAPKVHAIDTDIFAAVNQKLIVACADNKYGITEEACVHTVNDRKDRCQQWTVQKFEVQRPSIERMEAIVSDHTECVFQFAGAKAECVSQRN